MVDFSIAITEFNPRFKLLSTRLSRHTNISSRRSWSRAVVVTRSDLKQASPDRDGYRMGPIVGPELIHEILYVEIYGGLRDSQLIGNLFVSVSVSNEAKDFQFSDRKIVVAQMLGKSRRLTSGGTCRLPA